MTTSSKKHNNRLYLTTLVALFVVLSGFFAYISIRKHQGFESTGYDLGIFNQLLWKYSEFKTPENTIRLVDNLLSDHFHPILILLAPLYKLLPGPETLLVVQSLLMASVVFPVYLFTKSRFSQVVSLQAAALAGIFWGIYEAVLFDFHEIAFAVPLLGWLIYFMDQRRFIGYWIVLVLLLLTKEEFWIYAVFAGVILLAWKQYKAAIISMVGGLFGFVGVTKLIMPALSSSGQDFQYLKQYEAFGDSTLGIVFGVIARPFEVVKSLFVPSEKAITLWHLFAPLLFLPLVSPYLLLAIPSILQRMLSSNENLWTTSFHYNATIAAVLVMASIDTIHRISKRHPRLNLGGIALKPVYLVPTLLLINIIYVMRDDVLWYRAEGRSSYSTEVVNAGKQAIELIPANASVVADDGITPHISQRDEIYRIADLQWREPRTFDYIIESDVVADFFVTPEQAKANVQQLLEMYNYDLIFDQNSWRVYRLNQ